MSSMALETRLKCAPMEAASSRRGSKFLNSPSRSSHMEGIARMPETNTMPHMV